MITCISLDVQTLLCSINQLTLKPKKYIFLYIPSENKLHVFTNSFKDKLWTNQSINQSINHSIRITENLYDLLYIHWGSQIAHCISSTNFLLIYSYPNVDTSNLITIHSIIDLFFPKKL